MEVLDERAPEVMSDDELVRAIDQADLALAQVETRRLRLIADLDQRGYAERAGARDTVQFIEYRYRLDHYRARRDVLLARALPKYPLISAALPNYPTATSDPATSDPGTADASTASGDAGDAGDSAVLSDSSDSDGAGSDGSGSDGAGSDGSGSDSGGLPGRRLRPAQAEAIVFPLEKLPSTVPPADLEVAERELLRLAHHLAPSDLRKSAEQARNILDTDGPEPAEQKASARESLTLTNADHGVKFKGYLANDNAELLRTLITAAARPHKTLDGDPDPRSREKRQADALSTTLTLAATALDAGTPSPTIPRPTTPNPTPPSPAAPSPAAPDSSTSSPTAPSPTAPSPTAPSPTAPSPTAPDPAAPSPSASDPTAHDPRASSLAAPDPAVPDPAAPDPAAPDPAGPNPTAPNPTAPNPTAPNPAAPRPAASDPAARSRTAPDPAAPNPAAPSATAPDPSVSSPAASSPSASSPTAPDPAGPNPTTPRPAAPNPTAPDPAASDPNAPSPTAPDPNTSSPAASNPTAPDPTVSELAWSGAAADLGGIGGTGVGGAGVEGAGVEGGSGKGKAQGCGVAGDVVPGFGAKANLTVTIDLEDLKAATADAIGDTVYGNGLSAATIRRLACDANIIPIVLGSNSEPLDVGRSERLVTRAMRRALNTRDHGCVVCGAPPVMCDAHHLISWIDGGETKLNNLALLCRRHHVDLHNGHWTITITNGTVHVTRPHWADPPPNRSSRSNTASPSPGNPPVDQEPTSLKNRTQSPTRPPAPKPANPGTDAQTKAEHEEQAAPRDATYLAIWGEAESCGSATKTAPADRPLRMSTEGRSAWDGTVLPAASDSEIRSRRWLADHATYAEAARFAVWDGDKADDADPPSFATI